MAKKTKNRKNKHKNRKNKLVFKVKTPKGLVTAKDLDTNIEKFIEENKIKLKDKIVVVDFETGKKLGEFELGVVKLKFG